MGKNRHMACGKEVVVGMDRHMACDKEEEEEESDGTLV